MANFAQTTLTEACCCFHPTLFRTLTDLTLRMFFLFRSFSLAIARDEIVEAKYQFSDGFKCFVRVSANFAQTTLTEACCCFHPTLFRTLTDLTLRMFFLFRSFSLAIARDEIVEAKYQFLTASNVSFVFFVAKATLSVIQ